MSKSYPKYLPSRLDFEKLKAWDSTWRTRCYPRWMRLASEEYLTRIRRLSYRRKKSQEMFRLLQGLDQFQELWGFWGMRTSNGIETLISIPQRPCPEIARRFAIDVGVRILREEEMVIKPSPGWNFFEFAQPIYIDY